MRSTFARLLGGIFATLVLSCQPKPEMSVDQEVPPTTPAQSNASHSALHNVIEVAPDLLSGSVPEGDAAFAELERRGVRTVISVDGATPDLDAARRRGMRYVHLPVGYHGIDRDRQLELARAVRELPGPVYVHCHHGRHRGPAAAASAAVALGLLPADQGVEFMKQAGTSPTYTGLYQCVQQLSVANESQLAAVSNAFPEVAPVPGFVKAMAAAQDAYDHLVEIRDAGWSFLPSHPDLVPLAEAQLLVQLLDGVQSDPYRERHPPDFTDMLRESLRTAHLLESSLAADAPHAQRNEHMRRVNDACKACHQVYRNQR